MLRVLGKIFGASFVSSMLRVLGKIFGASFVSSMLISSSLAGGIPLLPATSQYSEPSQIVATMNAIINQLNGNASGAGGYAAQPNNAVSLGSLCQPAAGGSPLTCNGQRMILAYTGITVTTTGSTQTLVATNSSITAQSICSGQFTTAFTAGSAVIPATFTPSAGSLSIVIVNAGTTSNAVTTGTLGVTCTN